MGFCSLLIEPQSVDKSPLQSLIADGDNLAVIQVVNTSPTLVTIYKGITLGHFTPISVLLLVESQHPALPCIASLLFSDINLTKSALTNNKSCLYYYRNTVICLL